MMNRMLLDVESMQFISKKLWEKEKGVENRRPSWKGGVGG